VAAACVEQLPSTASTVDRERICFNIQDICNVSLCNRSCNKVANCLAIHGAYVLDPGSCIYLSEVASYVMDIVSVDLRLHRA